MKIFDLQCDSGHAFEGWFSSEGEFTEQKNAGLLSCPLCASSEVVRIPSAPRLNLKSRAASRAEPAQAEQPKGQAGVANAPSRELQAAWLKAVRHVMTHTEDVGERFAEEARRMHYGETKERGIRGQATREQTRDLLDEGIVVAPLLIPDPLKDTFQ